MDFLKIIRTFVVDNNNNVELEKYLEKIILKRINGLKPLVGENGTTFWFKKDGLLLIQRFTTSELFIDYQDIWSLLVDSKFDPIEGNNLINRIFESYTNKNQLKPAILDWRPKNGYEELIGFENSVLKTIEGVTPEPLKDGCVEWHKNNNLLFEQDFTTGHLFVYPIVYLTLIAKGYKYENLDYALRYILYDYTNNGFLKIKTIKQQHGKNY